MQQLLDRLQELGVSTRVEYSMDPQIEDDQIFLEVKKEGYYIQYSDEMNLMSLCHWNGEVCEYIGKAFPLQTVSAFISIIKEEIKDFI